MSGRRKKPATDSGTAYVGSARANTTFWTDPTGQMHPWRTKPKYTRLARVTTNTALRERTLSTSAVITATAAASTTRSTYSYTEPGASGTCHVGMV